MRCSDWCGECYSNCRGRSNYKGHASYRRCRGLTGPAPWEKPVKKPVVTPAGAPVEGVPVAGSVMGPYPDVWAMLTDDRWDDGSPRERSTILILVDGGTVKLWLNDRAMGRAAWVSGETVEGALEALNGALYDGTVAWRSQPQTKVKKK